MWGKICQKLWGFPSKGDVKIGQNCGMALRKVKLKMPTPPTKPAGKADDRDVTGKCLLPKRFGRKHPKDVVPLSSHFCCHLGSSTILVHRATWIKHASLECSALSKCQDISEQQKLPEQKIPESGF